MTKPSGNPPEKLLGFIVEQWKRLLSIALFIMLTIGYFWNDIPYTPGSDEAKKLTYFARFFVAVIIGLMLPLMMKKSNQHVYAKFWRNVAVSTFIVSIVAFFGYRQLLFKAWVVTTTINNTKKVLVTGSEVLDDDVKKFIEEYKKSHKKDISNKELLFNAAWNPKIVWTPESIRLRRLILSVAYVLLIPFFAITMVAVAQLISCAMSKE